MPIFSFLNPAFLWALPAAAIPVIIHLLSRRRLPEVRFPTTQFLRDLEPREIRRLKLREILLLILRTLALLLLVVGFARPALTPRNAVTHAAASMVVLYDDSESMGAIDEQVRPRHESARARAEAILDAVRPGDEIALVSSSRPEAAAAERSGDRVRMRRALERLAPTSLPGRMGAALREAKLLLGRSGLAARELYLVSDFQRTNFDAESRTELAGAAAAGIRIHFLPVVQSRLPNHAIGEVDPVLRPGPEGKGRVLRARLVNYSDAPSERMAIRVRRMDALIGGGDAALGSGENRWVAMPLDWRGLPDSVASAGPAIVETDEDALPADDRCFANLGEPRRLRVLRIAEGRDGQPPARFAALALDPRGDGSGGFEVETAAPAVLSTLPAARADVVLLEDVASLSADAEARLRAFVAAGGGVAIALGPHSDPTYYATRLFPGLIDLTAETSERAAEGGAFELKARIPGHRALEGLVLGVGSTLTQSRLTGLVRARRLTPRAEVVVETTGGLPVLVAAPHVSVFLSSLSDDWGDLPYSGAFVPLVRGLVTHAASAGNGASIATPRVGERPVARLASPPSSVLRVRGPAGYVSQAAVEAEGTGFAAVADAPAHAPGFYTFESGGRTVSVVAVNLDPIESDLAPIAVDSLRATVAGGAGGAASAAVAAGAGSAPGRGPDATVLSSVGALATHLRETRRGRELWLGFLIAAALVLSAELWVGSLRTLKP